MANEYLSVAEIILSDAEGALSARQIVDRALSRKLFSDSLSGVTPWQTMKARLSEEIRAHGARSMFVRLAPGRFQLRRNAQPNAVYEAPPFRPPPPKERCLVVSRDTVARYVDFQGIAGGRRAKRVFAALLRPENCKYVERHIAEQDDLHKQVLTYVMVESRGRLLSYQRGRYNRVEEYLRGSLCVGFGGHVNERDLTLLNRVADQGVSDNARRELTEELRLPAEDMRRLSSDETLALVGVINDDSSAVGRRHIAFVFRYETSDAVQWSQPRRGEKSIRQLRWLDFERESIHLERFEYWSQLCLRAFFSKVVREQPSYQIRRRQAFRKLHTLCVLGPIGSGKTEATRALVEDFHYEEVNSGRVLAGLLGLPPVPETPRETFQQAALEFISHRLGPRRLGKALAQAANEKPQRALIDGIRHPTTLEAVRNSISAGSVGVIYVHTPPDVAFRFYQARAGTEAAAFVDFVKVREALVEREVADMIGLADAVLYNWWGRSSYRNAIRSLMRDLGLGAAK